MTTIAATLVVALLVVVAAARLSSIVSAGIAYVANRPARQPRHAVAMDNGH